jgi:hypothetical protein
MIRLARSLVCAVALVALLTIAGTAQADEITGTIVILGTYGDALTVMGDDRNVYSFHVIANSNARLNGSQVQIANLQSGDRVRVLYDNKDGYLILKEIDAQR